MPTTQLAIMPGQPVPLLQTYHPFPFVLASGQRDKVRAEDGREFYDFYGGHCVCGTGHCHPLVTAALNTQMQSLTFYSTAARLRTREAAARKLVDFAGSGMSACFFCNSGSEANESALKLALKQTGRKRFVAFNGSFHGRSLLALSVTDQPSLREPYAELLAPASFLQLNCPLDPTDFLDVAAVIIEPIQSMAGVRMAETRWLLELSEHCKAAGCLLIFDEVQTGFGRLGSSFAAEQYGLLPDMITCAKAMASGFPMGAVLVNEQVAAKVEQGDLGSTFGGGPLACAALMATLEIISAEDLASQALTAEAFLRKRLAQFDWLHVQGRGLLLGIVASAQAAQLKMHLLEAGVLVGGSADPSVLRLMPPLNVSQEALEALCSAIADFDNNFQRSAELGVN